MDSDHALSVVVSLMLTELNTIVEYLLIKAVATPKCSRAHVTLVRR